MSKLVREMRAKARENFAAAAVLAEETGRYPNALSSRAYYALYQACVAEIENSHPGKLPKKGEGGQRRYEHATVKQNLGWVGLTPKDKDLYRDIHDLRVKADYWDIPVEMTEIGPDVLAEVRELLRSLGVNIGK